MHDEFPEMLKGFVLGDRALDGTGDTHTAWMLAHAALGSVLVVGVSALGHIHLTRGTPRDDAFLIRAAGPWLAVGVADGVGSRPLSRYGATYTVESLTACLLRPLVPLPLVTPQKPAAPVGLGEAGAPRSPGVPEPLQHAADTPTPYGTLGTVVSGMATPPSAAKHPPPVSDLLQGATVGWWFPPAATQRPHHAPTSGSRMTAPHPETAQLLALMHQSFTQTHMGLQAHAESLGVQTIDLSCTGLALLLNCETGHGVVGQVGDGVLLGLTRQGKIQPLVEAQKGPEPLSTYTISHATFLEHLAVAAIKPSSVDPWQSFYLMTDGLANDLLHAPRSAGLVFWAQQVRRKLSRASQVAEAATQLLHWLSTYQVTGSFDDRTLVVVTQREDVQARHQRAANPPA